GLRFGPGPVQRLCHQPAKRVFRRKLNYRCRPVLNQAKVRHFSAVPRYRNGPLRGRPPRSPNRPDEDRSTSVRTQAPRSSSTQASRETTLKSLPDLPCLQAANDTEPSLAPRQRSRVPDPLTPTLD